METVCLYLDILFLFNFILNLVLVFLVSYTCSHRVSWGRAIFAAGVGSIYLCVLCAWEYSFLEHLCFKILVSCFMIFTAFHVKRFREFLKLFFVYYLMSFLLAGGISFSESFLEKKLLGTSLLAVAIGTLLAILFGQLYFYSIRKKCVQTEKTFQLTYNGKTLYLRGFSDTGNTLVEPMEHLGVIVVKEELLKELADFSHPETLKNIRLIPCRTVTDDNSLLFGFKPDALLCEQQPIRAIVAASDRINREEYDAIFNPLILMS